MTCFIQYQLSLVKLQFLFDFYQLLAEKTYGIVTVLMPPNFSEKIVYFLLVVINATDSISQH